VCLWWVLLLLYPLRVVDSFFSLGNLFFLIWLLQYFLTRQAINHANILVFNYQYMLDPKVAKMVSKELESESIIVFDEAHNIDSVCIEALSVTINDRGLEQATRSLGRLSSEVSRLKATDSQRLQQEYQNLVNGLIDQGLLDAPANDAALGSVSSCMNYSIEKVCRWSIYHCSLNPEFWPDFVHAERFEPRCSQ